MPRIITVTSGKGGVGKTSISLNLSLSLAAEGFKVCLFDADLGLANVNILTGIYPEKDLESVISGQFSLDEILIKDFMGIDIIPGSNGVEKIADLTRTQTGTLIAAFLEMEEYDFFIFDTSAGISAQVLSFCMASHEIILVATCEPTSLTDAYAMLKVLSKYKYQNPVRIVINQVTAGKAAQKAYNRLKQTAGRFLSIPLSPLGVMAADKNVKAAVISQTPFFRLFPDTVATRCIRSMTDRLLKKENIRPGMPIELFWDKVIRFLDAHHPAKTEPVSGGNKARTEDQKQAQGDTDAAMEKVLGQLSDLDRKMTVLAEDVALIKQMLQQNAAPPEQPADPLAAEPDSVVKKENDPLMPETLDFESWYRRQNHSF
jgi:flagellar biosynthesis protein FlhG